MNDLRFLRMQIIESITKLIGPTENIVRREGAVAAFLHFEQVFAGNKLHHQKLAIAFIEMIAHSRQSLMVQTGEQARLTLKLFSQSFVSEQGLFESDHCIQSLIKRLVNCAHTALPELAHDAISFLRNFFRYKHFLPQYPEFVEEFITPTAQPHHPSLFSIRKNCEPRRPHL